MQKYEKICGFSVKKIPQKPDFLPVSQEEFVYNTLEAWAHGDEDSRVSAVFHGGVREWSALWKDESYKVRGAVACRASEEYQLKLVCDPITPVRERLAMGIITRHHSFNMKSIIIDIPPFAGQKRRPSNMEGLLLISV